MSDIAIDESSFAVALGSSGKVELWDVRLIEICGQYDMVDPGCRAWTAQAVGDGGGVYSVDMNTSVERKLQLLLRWDADQCAKHFADSLQTLKGSDTAYRL